MDTTTNIPENLVKSYRAYLEKQKEDALRLESDALFGEYEYDGDELRNPYEVGRGRSRSRMSRSPSEDVKLFPQRNQIRVVNQWQNTPNSFEYSPPEGHRVYKVSELLAGTHEEPKKVTKHDAVKAYREVQDARGHSHSTTVAGADPLKTEPKLSTGDPKKSWKKKPKKRKLADIKKIKEAQKKLV